jgi:hypothetical protein
MEDRYETLAKSRFVLGILFVPDFFAYHFLEFSRVRGGSLYPQVVVKYETPFRIRSYPLSKTRRVHNWRITRMVRTNLPDPVYLVGQLARCSLVGSSVLDV